MQPTCPRLALWFSSALVTVACGDVGDGTATDGAATSDTINASSTPPDSTGSPTTGPGEGTSTGTPTTDLATGDSSDVSADPTAATATTATTETTETTDETTGDPDPLALPPADGGFDYQLGDAYPPPAGVVIVARDRTASPEPGMYNICYVNGFQAQPDAADWWLGEHPELILRDEMGDPVIDVDWDEMLLDTSTAEKRAALAVIVGEWIAGCGADGFDAVEIDNLDSYARSTGLLTQDAAVATMALYSGAAHAVGLAIAQKNSTELVDRRGEMGTDFAVAEECSTYDECGDYVGAYGDAVLMIEYVPDDFQSGCAAWPGHSIVLRDLNLVGPMDGDYVFDAC